GREDEVLAVEHEPDRRHVRSSVLTHRRQLPGPRPLGQQSPPLVVGHLCHGISPCCGPIPHRLRQPVCHESDRSGKVPTSARSWIVEPDGSYSGYSEGTGANDSARRHQTRVARAVPPAATASTLAALVDLLLPGDDLFPPASAVGAQALLAERIRQRFGPTGVVDVVARLTVDA